ncbi:MAG: S8 family serine peptidase [Minwuiales bacterium]|nr:S8 family serine peptidase [Minwuiales bacterium]
MAYDNGATGAGVTVAVIDTGVQASHPELASKLSPNSIDITTMGAQTDTDGHGTAVAGIVAAPKNDVDVHGVAFGSTILSIKASDVISTFSETDLTNAVNYAVANGADVINLSLGGNFSVFGSFANALQNATAAGVIVVASTGNDGNAFGPLDPAGFAGRGSMNDLLLAVGATDSNRDLAGFSNACGFSSISASNAFCLLAPGVSVPTSGLGGGLVAGTGTSFAAPHVSGAAALLLQLFPSLTPAQVVEILLTTAIDLGVPGIDVDHGRGLLNLDAASQPLGTLSIPTSDKVVGASAELAHTTLRLGPAFGDALGGVAMLNDAIILDSYDRPFKVGLANNVTSAKRDFGLDNLLAYSTLETVDLPGPNGLSLSLGLDNRGYYRDPGLGLTEAPYAGPSLENMSAIGTLREGTDLGFAFNLSAGHQIAAQSGRPDPARLFWASDESLNPHLGLIGPGRGVSLGQSIGESTRLSFAWLERQDGDDSVSRGSIGQAFLDHRFADGASIRFGIASALEDGAFLNSDATGAFGAGTESDSRFYSVSGVLPLTEHVNLIGSATLADTRVVGDGNSLLGDWDRVWSSAFGFGVTADGVIDDRDSIGFLVGQPLRVENAEARLTVPVARDLDGNVIQQSDRVDLTPSGREIDFQIAYQRSLAPGVGLSSWLMMQLQPGHDDSAEPGYGAGVKLQVTY